jgi:NADH:ubiquinone oxidoreductase subunit K
MFIFFLITFSINILAIFLFFLGVFGIIFNYNKNIIITLISIELSLLAINLNFIFSSLLLNDIVGLIFALFILTGAAAEAAIGLAILVLFFRVRGNIFSNHAVYLRG